MEACRPSRELDAGQDFLTLQSPVRHARWRASAGMLVAGALWGVIVAALRRFRKATAMGREEGANPLLPR